MKPTLYVQIIRTTWTKRSRGAPAATARALVPLWLPVDVVALRRGELTVEIFDFNESDFSRPFDSKMETRELTNDLRYEQGAFTLRWNGKTAQTDWHWSAWNVGAPKPNFLHPRAPFRVVAAITLKCTLAPLDTSFGAFGIFWHTSDALMAHYDTSFDTSK